MGNTGMRYLFFIAFLALCLTIVFTSLIYAQSSPRDLYIVGIKDIIGIRVAGQGEFTGDYKVAFDGTINYPYLGAIFVENLTLKEIQQKIEEGLSNGYVKSPIVTVSLNESLSKKIYVQGKGTIPYEYNLTVTKVLLLTGTLQQLNAGGKVIIRRIPEGKTGYLDTIIDMRDVLEGKESGNTVLKPDDIIIIKSPDSILLQGEVLKPGFYPLEHNTTLEKVLALAGGIREGALYGKIKVRRLLENNSGYKDIELNVKDLIDGRVSGEMLLQPEDIVRVEPNKSFYIHGEVNSVGKFTLEDNMTVVKAITEAGGITAGGLYGKVKIRRKRSIGVGYEDIEVNLRGIIDGSIKEDVLIYPDDILIVERNKRFFIKGIVNSPGLYTLEDKMTIVKAITIAGGIREGSLNGVVEIRRIRDDKSGYDDIELDLQDVLTGKSAGDMLLHPDDTVNISRGKTYIMYGEVRGIGEYPISKDTTIFKAILRAGGFTEWGSPRRIKILRPKNNGGGFDTIKVNIKKLLDGDDSADIPLQAGDIVIVQQGLF
jgi:polysaccharide export outer membrane protein